MNQEESLFFHPDLTMRLLLLCDVSFFKSKNIYSDYEKSKTKENIYVLETDQIYWVKPLNNGKKLKLQVKFSDDSQWTETTDLHDPARATSCLLRDGYNLYTYIMYVYICSLPAQIPNSLIRFALELLFSFFLLFFFTRDGINGHRKYGKLNIIPIQTA